jgi:uncharacterized protein YbbK (DUF523 family)
MKEKLLISACLIGQNVKYNGKNNQIDLSKFQQKYTLIPFCPEVEGGLPTPRTPSEIISLNPIKLIDKNGKDVTQNFILGAKKALELSKKEGIKKALLKSNSPSCSSEYIYDGSFSGKLIKGKGITTLFLEKEGIEVFDEKSEEIKNV